MAAADLQTLYDKFHRHLAAKGYIVIAPHYHRPPLMGNVLGAFYQVPTDWVKAGIKGAQAGYEYYKNRLPGLIDPGEYAYGIPAPDDQGEGGLVYGVAGHSIGGVIGTALANPTIRNSVPGAEDFDWNPKAVVLMSSGQSGDLSLRCPGWVAQVYCTKGPLAFFAHTVLQVDNHYWDPDWRYDPDRCAFGEYVGGQHCMVTDGLFMSGDLSEITYNPLWIVMVGEADWEIGETPALQAYCKATNITDKHYLRALSDSRGQPPLKAKHSGAMGDDLFPPIWTDQVDAHDYYGYWKIVTAAMNCAIHDQDCDYARGGTDEQLSMGNWSDGEPVKRMQGNPEVRDNDGICYPLEDACEMVNDIDPVTQESAWNWRGPGIPADCDN